MIPRITIDSTNPGPGLFILRTVIYSLLLCVFFIDFLCGYLSILPRMFTWINEILSLFLLFLIFADLSLQRLNIKINFLILIALVWVIIAILGVMVNGVNFFVFLAGFRNYFKFLPLFFALSWYPLPDKLIRNIIQCLILISTIQIFFIIPEKIYYYGLSGDLIVGSLGANASGILVIFQMLVFSLLISLYKSNYYSTKAFIFYSVLILSSTFITEGKIVFFILPIIFIVYFLEISNLKKSFALVFIGLSVFIAGVFIYNYIYGDIGKYLLKSDKTEAYLGLNEISYVKINKLRRIPQVYFMFKNINKTIYKQVIGVGIGNASESYFQRSNGEYYKKFGFLGITRVFLAKLGWEFGYTGIILFLGLLLYLYFVNYGTDLDQFENGIINAKKGIVIVTLSSLIYDSALTTNQLSFTFWLYLGILNNISFRKSYGLLI